MADYATKLAAMIAMGGFHRSIVRPEEIDPRLKPMKRDSCPRPTANGIGNGRTKSDWAKEARQVASVETQKVNADISSACQKNIGESAIW